MQVQKEKERQSLADYKGKHSWPGCDYFFPWASWQVEQKKSPIDASLWSAPRGHVIHCTAALACLFHVYCQPCISVFGENGTKKKKKKNQYNWNQIRDHIMTVIMNL